ncbi:hypothetical protein ACOMHN_000675 [Nucella lapillus]
MRSRDALCAARCAEVSTPCSGPVTHCVQDAVLAPGGWINLGLALNTNQRIRLVVTSCYAGPDLSDPTKPKQALLLDK